MAINRAVSVAGQAYVPVALDSLEMQAIEEMVAEGDGQLSEESRIKNDKFNR